MKDYINEILERANIQSVSSFLMGGAECFEIDNQPYIQRIKEAEEIIEKIIKNKISDKTEYEEMIVDVFSNVGIIQDVYLEIGMKCGAMLTAQLLSKKF